MPSQKNLHPIEPDPGAPFPTYVYSAVHALSTYIGGDRAREANIIRLLLAEESREAAGVPFLAVELPGQVSPSIDPNFHLTSESEASGSKTSDSICYMNAISLSYIKENKPTNPPNLKTTHQ